MFKHFHFVYFQLVLVAIGKLPKNVQWEKEYEQKVMIAGTVIVKSAT